MRIGMIEPHLRCYGGIRRVLEFGNRLTARGHEVTYFLPQSEPQGCDWMQCSGRVDTIENGRDATLDVILFNHEPQWFLLDNFVKARRRVFYALHYAKLCGKEGVWEAMRTDVDLQLANSTWTADRIEDDIGHRPTVQLGGANREMFRPFRGPKRYPLLCNGELGRDWKGTATIVEASALAGVPLETYYPKQLDQSELGREYDAAEIFAVGSWFEGFCQPGLEALACGVPLVTTDNGGCLEYAHHGETALVVPPRDPRAMAEAITALRDDPAQGRQLVAAGLDLVADSFDWEQRTDELATVLDGVVAGTALAPPPPRPDTPAAPELSIVTLAWDNLHYTQHFVESARQNTEPDYELIIVDNGSQPLAASYARSAADTSVMNDHNLGFSHGMNQGHAVAKGTWIAFCNNDTILPERWAEMLLETARDNPNAGIVVPALTAAGNRATVRTSPGTDVVTLDPFSAPPAAVVYLMSSDLVLALGGWGEEYTIASAEDVDLAFKVWTNGLDIVYDQRVLVEHVSKATARHLDDWQTLWTRNRQMFLDKWSGDAAVPRIESCPPAEFERNRRIARAAAQWMDRYFAARDHADHRTRFGKGGPVRARMAEQALNGWRSVSPHLPPALADTVRTLARKARP